MRRILGAQMVILTRINSYHGQWFLNLLLGDSAPGQMLRTSNNFNPNPPDVLPHPNGVQLLFRAEEFVSISRTHPAQAVYPMTLHESLCYVDVITDRGLAEACLEIPIMQR